MLVASLQVCRREKGKEEGVSGEEEGIRKGCKESKESYENQKCTELERLPKHPGK